LLIELAQMMDRASPQDTTVSPFSRFSGELTKDLLFHYQFALHDAQGQLNILKQNQ
jgi:hypothetical protein